MMFNAPARPAGVDASAYLLPADGAAAAERRTHPRHTEPFGLSMPSRLADLPDEVAGSVADACDDNFGIAGEAHRVR